VISFATYSRVQFANERGDGNHGTAPSRMFVSLRSSREAAEDRVAIMYLESRDSWQRLRKLMGR
jgi:hypothetical protein